MEQDSVDKIEYISFEKLPSPSADKIAQVYIEVGFTSKEWYIQFQTLTNLRQANRYYSSLFLNELIPLNYKQILAQIQNLRSNNSKEAITLVSEIFQHQKIELIQNSIMRLFVSALMTKSVSEKAFIKNQAMKGLNFLPGKWSQGVLEELCAQTQSPNGQISQLAIKLLAQMIESNKNYEADGKFLKNLSHNLNGKRAVLQKKAKQILGKLKQREGEERLEKKINSSQELLEEQSNTLRRELKEKEQKSKGPSFRDFLKSKKQES